ncbi:LysR family transcriptional regulator [Bordetella genomosp. 8]|uniref:LysR family transcriptional regulator n=1 Tax=Bordetella genomosp. 8 TaxID=1416806 RepID=A0A1W6YLP1_9BORD|nr:LysR family transcriptional regulator [Bordetella genomosp. 8]ARP81938.1 LysR family transcriptional regulator [Bordetella genomosp. 8]
MDIQRLDYFVRVCEAGSFTRAAAEVGLSQPSLSRQIALLELELGQRLLERTGRGVAPTEAGQALLPHARAMLDLAQQARNQLVDLQAQPTGRLDIGLPPRLARSLTLPLVQFFRKEFPRVALSVQEGLTIHLREWLIAGRLDAALLFDPPASPQLACEVLLREPLFLVAAGSGPRLPARVRARTLVDHPLILPPEPNALRVLLDTVMKPYGLFLQPIVEIGSAQTLMTLVRRGIGHTVLPQGALAAYAAGGDIQASRIGPAPISSCIVLATPIARPSTRVTRAAIQILRQLAEASRADQPALSGEKQNKAVRTAAGAPGLNQ